MRRVLVVMAAFALGSLTACSDDGGGSEEFQAFCDKAAEIDEASDALFAEIEGLSTADATVILLDFTEEHLADFEQLRDLAPDDLSDDVQVIIDQQIAYRDSGGDFAAVDTDANAAADANVSAFQADSC